MFSKIVEVGGCEGLVMELRAKFMRKGLNLGDLAEVAGFSDVK